MPAFQIGADRERLLEILAGYAIHAADANAGDDLVSEQAVAKLLADLQLALEVFGRQERNGRLLSYSPDATIIIHNSASFLGWCCSVRETFRFLRSAVSRLLFQLT